MAFGDPLGTAMSGQTTSIPASFATTVGSATVAVGDLVVAVVCEQSVTTQASAASDNLGNTYTAQNAGSIDSAGKGGRAFYSIVTVAGTITAVTATCTSSAHDATIVARAYAGPVTAIDANPANILNDITTPYDWPATGVLAQASEIVIGWGTAGSAVVSLTPTGPFVYDSTASQSNSGAVIGHYVVSSTASTNPSATGTAPVSDVFGTMSFKATAADVLRAQILT